MTDEIAINEAKSEYIGYNEAIELMKNEIHLALTSSPQIICNYTTHLSTSFGKFIRAVSLITCALNKDNQVHKNAVQLAAAVEILHLATLVHDDVMDNANLRRGVLTLQKKFGKRTAVICGDYLLCVALKMASKISNKKDYLEFYMPDYVEKICLGELNQSINNSNFDLSIYNYLKIISGKTAALFEASFYAGGVLCEGDKSAVIKKYKRLGHYIGMIFQLTDDCMDFEASEHIAKKPVQSDYEQGVITLPLIHALKNLQGFKEKAIENKLTQADVNEGVKTAKGISFTRMISKNYYNKAMKLIDEIEASTASTEVSTELSTDNFVDKRKKLISILDKAFGL